MPPQIRYSPAVAAIEGVAENTGTAINILTPSTLLSTLLVGSMSLMWGLINTLQIVSHLPLVEVQMPANAKMIFDITLSIASFDNPLTEELKEWILEKIDRLFSSENPEEEPASANRRFLSDKLAEESISRLGQTLQ